jgi:hypothetical protein
MENMEVLWCSDEHKATFVLPPFTFHAVMTFSPSAHSGLKVWSLWWFKEAQEVMSWEIE